MAFYGKNTDWKNEEAYLNNLVSKGGGEGQWAQGQLNVLAQDKADWAKQQQDSPSYTQTTSYTGGSGGGYGGGYSGGLGAYSDTLDPQQAKYLNYILETGTIDDFNAAADWIDSKNGTYREGTLWGRSDTVPQQQTLDLEALLQKYMPAAQPQYSPSDDSLYRQLVQRAIDQNYDTWTQSDQYKALADRYGQQGKMTMQDILGQISSRTGGLASSYATTAAQQQYNDYMAQLEQAARKQYSEDYNDLVDKVGMAKGLADDEYQKYLDQLSQYNNDRSYAMDIISQALSQSQYNQQWQNTLDQQAWERAQAEDNTAYKRGQDAQNAAQDQILTYIGAGQMPPDALIASSGWDRDYVALLLAQKQGTGTYNSTYKAPSGTPKNTTPTTTPTASSPYGESQNIETSINLPTNVDYSPDEGVIVWNGHRYSSKAAFEDDIENAYNRGNLTSSQVQKILNSLNAMGLKF